MRDQPRASTVLFALSVAGGCNALFNVEEPVLVEARVEGGAAGAGASPQLEGGDAAESSGGARGSNEPIGGEGGSAGEPPGAPPLGVGGESGSGGSAEPPLLSAGSPSQHSGGASGAGGALGVGGDENASGGALEPTGGAGGAGCTGASSRCVNDHVREVCEDDAVRQEDCPHGCLNDECAACDAGTVECDQNNRTRVCEDGQFGPWATCVNQTCVPDVGCDRDCAPGQVRCNTENGDAEKCVAGQWTLEDVCISQTRRCIIENEKAICIDNDFYPLGPEKPLTGGALESQTPDFLQLFPLPSVEATAVVAEMGLVGDGAPAYAQMVLYEDNGSGYPGALLTFTSTIDVEGPGPNTKAPVSAVRLDPEKDYWIGVVFASSGSPELHCRQTSGAPKSYERSQAFTAAFPQQFPAAATPTFDRECNLFSRVRTLTP